MSDFDGLFGIDRSVPHTIVGRPRPFDDAGAPYVLVPYPVPTGAVVRSTDEFLRLCPKATVEERAEVDALLIAAPCVHVIPRI